MHVGIDERGGGLVKRRSCADLVCQHGEMPSYLAGPYRRNLVVSGGRWPLENGPQDFSIVKFYTFQSTDWWKDLKRPFFSHQFPWLMFCTPKVCCCHFVLHFWLKLFVFESLSVWLSVVVRDEGKPLVCFFLVFLTFQPKFKCHNLILTWKIPCFILVTLSCPHTFISHACQCQHLQALRHYDGAKHLQYDSVWLYTNFSALHWTLACALVVSEVLSSCWHCSCPSFLKQLCWSQVPCEVGFPEMIERCKPPNLLKSLHVIFLYAFVIKFFYLHIGKVGDLMTFDMSFLSCALRQSWRLFWQLKGFWWKALRQMVGCCAERKLDENGCNSGTVVELRCYGTYRQSLVQSFEGPKNILANWSTSIHTKCLHRLHRIHHFECLELWTFWSCGSFCPMICHRYFKNGIYTTVTFFLVQRVDPLQLSSRAINPVL